MKSMTIDQIVEYLDNEETNDDFAFRGDDEEVVGSFNNSCYHGDDEPEYELGGVSAIVLPRFNKDNVIESICKARAYGKNVYLLRGLQINADEATHDPDEVLIQENKIVCVVCADFIEHRFRYFKIV